MTAMSEEHKQAMAKGRRQARAVKNYLEALEVGRRDGRKPSADALRTRISDTTEAIEESESPIKRLELIQKRMDDEQALRELEAQERHADRIEDLEADFVEVAADYGQRKGITYKAWRELGVAAATLREAGITRGS